MKGGNIALLSTYCVCPARLSMSFASFSSHLLCGEDVIYSVLQMNKFRPQSVKMTCSSSHRQQVPQFEGRSVWMGGL